MMTSKTKYALRALARLAREGQGNAVLIAAISESEGIPRKFLEQILLALKQRGLVFSRKGRGGGYALARDPATIPVSDVVRMMDGPLAPVPCVSKTAYRRCPECTDEATCCVRAVMQDVRDAIASILDRVSIQDLSQSTRHLPTALNYDI